MTKVYQSEIIVENNIKFTILTLQILQILTALNTQVSINQQKHYKLYLPRWLCILTHI